MKIRNGFVSNSSSSSFILHKDKLTEDQILLIKNHHLCNVIPYAGSDSWSVSEHEDGTIHLYTIQDNFNMYQYLSQIVRIPYDSIEYSDYFIDKEDFINSLDSEAERILNELKREQ